MKKILLTLTLMTSSVVFTFVDSSFLHSNAQIGNFDLKTIELIKDEFNRNTILEVIKERYPELRIIILGSDDSSFIDVPELIFKDPDVSSQQSLSYENGHDCYITKESVQGLFAQPFLNSHVDKCLLVPLISYPRILLRKRTSRRVIIHEFLHFINFKLRNNGEVYFTRDKSLLNKYNFLAAQQIEAMKKTESIERLKLYLKYIISKMNIYRLSFGDEIDVSHFILKNREILNLTKQEAFMEFKYLSSNLTKTGEKISELIKDFNLYWTTYGSQILSSDENAVNIFNEFVTTKDNIIEVHNYYLDQFHSYESDLMKFSHLDPTKK